MSWQGKECQLSVHHDSGFLLTDISVGPDDVKKSPVVWQFPYEKLRMSADDNSQLLWLDFGDGGEQVSSLFVSGGK